ncbi:MAG TPA: aldo/keto reductase, partial [Ramlibacter sp.]
QDEWRLVTKTLPLRCERIGDHELRAVDAAFHESLRRLGVARVDTLLVHHAQDLLAPGGEELHTWLLERKSEGTALRVGASVYDGDEVAALLDRFDIDVVQLPANIADQRLLADGSIPQLHGSDVEVHVRSLFLQGVLLAAPAFAAKRFPEQVAWVASFHAECARRNVTPQQACLSFFKSRDEFTAAVVGVSSAAELSQLLAAWDSAPAMDWSGWAVDNKRFTDPRLWNT